MFGLAPEFANMYELVSARFSKPKFNFLGDRRPRLATDLPADMVEQSCCSAAYHCAKHARGPGGGAPPPYHVWLAGKFRGGLSFLRPFGFAKRLFSPVIFH
jgi:hypothetical protein